MFSCDRPKPREDPLVNEGEGKRSSAHRTDLAEGVHPLTQEIGFCQQIDFDARPEGFPCLTEPLASVADHQRVAGHGADRAHELELTLGRARELGFRSARGWRVVGRADGTSGS